MSWLWPYVWGGANGIPLGICLVRWVETRQAHYVWLMALVLIVAVAGVLVAACWGAYKELNEPMLCETCGKVHT